MTTEKRILVVDDDDAIRALLFTVFRRRGFKVDAARNGIEALERCNRCRYSVVVLDLMMPLLSGYEVLERLSTQSRMERPLVLVLTAGTEPRNLDPGLVAATMKKPFDIELLVHTISSCLDTLDDQTQRTECPAADSERQRDTPRGLEKAN
jgi:DNA-binding response OmpR family regulator